MEKIEFLTVVFNFFANIYKEILENKKETGYVVFLILVLAIFIIFLIQFKMKNKKFGRVMLIVLCISISIVLNVFFFIQPSEQHSYHYINSSVTASDYLDEKYKPLNVIDGNPNTNWQFQSNSNVFPHYLEFKLSEPAYIKQIEILNGGKRTPDELYEKNSSQYMRNGRLKGIEIYARHVNETKFQHVQSYELADNHAVDSWETIELTPSEKVAYIRIQAVDYYTSNARNPNDIIVSEIKLFGY